MSGSRQRASIRAGAERSAITISVAPLQSARRRPPAAGELRGGPRARGRLMSAGRWPPTTNGGEQDFETELRAVRDELSRTIARARDLERGAQGVQRGNHLDERGAPVGQRGARDLEGGAAVAQRGAEHRQQSAPAQGRGAGGHDQRPPQSAGEHRHRDRVPRPALPDPLVHARDPPADRDHPVRHRPADQPFRAQIQRSEFLDATPRRCSTG